MVYISSRSLHNDSFWIHTERFLNCSGMLSRGGAILAPKILSTPPRASNSVLMAQREAIETLRQGENGTYRTSEARGIFPPIFGAYCKTRPKCARLAPNPAGVAPDGAPGSDLSQRPNSSPQRMLPILDYSLCRCWVRSFRMSRASIDRAACQGT